MTHFSVTCPCGSGHTVEASDAGFSATTVTVAACQICRTAGIVSREMRKSYGVEHYVSVPSLQHSNGTGRVRMTPMSAKLRCIETDAIDSIASLHRWSGLRPVHAPDQYARYCLDCGAIEIDSLTGFNRDEFACLVHRLDPDDFTRCRVCGASSRSHAEAFALGLLRWEEMNGSWSSESE